MHLLRGQFQRMMNIIQLEAIIEEINKIKTTLRDTKAVIHMLATSSENLPYFA